MGLRPTVVLSVCPHLSVVTDSQTTVHTHLVVGEEGRREVREKERGRRYWRETDLSRFNLMVISSRG